MTSECKVKSVVSESLIQKDPIPSVGPEFYKSFCLGLPDWCPFCKKMAEQQKGKLLSLKRPHVTLSDQESSKKSNKPIDRLQTTSSNQEKSEKSIADNRTHATPLYHDNSKKSDRIDERYWFEVTFDELSKFKEGECPANTEKNTEWVIRNFESWRSARNKRYPEEQCPPNVLFETDSNEMRDWVCANIYPRHAK